MKGFLSKLRRKLAGSNDTTVHPDLDPVVDSELSEVEPLPAVEQAKPNSGTTKSASDPEDLIRDGFHPDPYVFGSEVQDPVNRDPAEAVKWTEAAAASSMQILDGCSSLCSMLQPVRPPCQSLIRSNCLKMLCRLTQSQRSISLTHHPSLLDITR